MPLTCEVPRTSPSGLLAQLPRQLLVLTILDSKVSAGKNCVCLIHHCIQSSTIVLRTKQMMKMYLQKNLVSSCGEVYVENISPAADLSCLKHFCYSYTQGISLSFSCSFFSCAFETILLCS